MDKKITKLHLYTGDGKGKTTAAMGLALRALGSGWRVLVAQFLKTGRSSELEALRAFPNAIVVGIEPIGKFTFKMTPEEKECAKARENAEVERLLAMIAELKPQLMVFDELALAAHMGMVDEDFALRLIDAGLAVGEVVTTGRYAPEALKTRADYMSVIASAAHPYSKGLNARKGIEF